MPLRFLLAAMMGESCNPAVDDLNFTAGLVLAERTVNNNYAVNTQFRRLDFYDAGYTMTGTLGLTYQLETSADLETWTIRQSVKAHLQTGTMLFEFFNPKTDPRLFLRVGLP